MVDSCKNIDFENLLGSKLVWSKYAQTCVWSKDAASITTTIVNTQQKKNFHQNESTKFGAGTIKIHLNLFPAQSI